MSNDAKEELRYVLSLLKMVVMHHHLSVASDDKGHVLFMSTDEYLEKQSVKDCDGIVIDIKNLVR